VCGFCVVCTVSDVPPSILFLGVFFFCACLFGGVRPCVMVVLCGGVCFFVVGAYSWVCARWVVAQFALVGADDPSVPFFF